MFPPTLILSTDSSDSTNNRPEVFQLVADSDPESLRHNRRPSTISRARRTLDTITESVASLTGLFEGPTRFFDGHIVEVCTRPVVNRTPDDVVS